VPSGGDLDPGSRFGAALPVGQVDDRAVPAPPRGQLPAARTRHLEAQGGRSPRGRPHRSPPAWDSRSPVPGRAGGSGRLRAAAPRSPAGCRCRGRPPPQHLVVTKPAGVAGPPWIDEQPRDDLRWPGDGIRIPQGRPHHGRRRTSTEGGAATSSDLPDRRRDHGQGYGARRRGRPRPTLSLSAAAHGRDRQHANPGQSGHITRFPSSAAVVRPAAGRRLCQWHLRWRTVADG